jgi:hypothetical protein
MGGNRSVFFSLPRINAPLQGDERHEPVIGKAAEAERDDADRFDKTPLTLLRGGAFGRVVTAVGHCLSINGSGAAVCQWG